MFPSAVFSARGIAVLTLLAVSACSGGASRALPPVTGTPAGGTAAVGGASGSAQATLHVSIPAATTVASQRRAQYVSA
jgi:hypothetical protein